MARSEATFGARHVPMLQESCKGSVQAGLNTIDVLCGNYPVTYWQQALNNNMIVRYSI